MSTYDGTTVVYDPSTVDALRPRLALSLRDPSMEVWSSDELDDLLALAVISLYPRVARTMSTTITTVDGDTSEYAIPDGLVEITRVDVIETSTGDILFHVPNGAWETRGDPLGDDYTLYVNRSYLDTSRDLELHGYVPYDLVEHFPPEQHTSYILAHARVDALMTMLPKRASFEKWLTLNQKENVSVNEIAQMVAQAEGEIDRHERRFRTWRKPVPARR